MWDRLGYPRRALRLHEAAQAMVERHGGDVPDDEDVLRQLPGVGAYTAAAVATFAYGRRTCVVDTNVRRVLARSVTGVAYPARAPTAAETALATALVPDDAADAATWAVASMELGALVCTARSPRCSDCPVLDRCAWQAAGTPAHAGPPRRGQTYAGTDRYVRGLVLAALRASPGPVTHDGLVDRVPDDLLRDPSQRERCLDSLVADGLVEPFGDAAFRLPTAR
jgi:A/G-specific adenine glycosylase